MKTTKKQFEYFKERCLYWQERFGLGQWLIDFGHEALENSYAETTKNFLGMKAYIRFTLCLDRVSMECLDIDRTACHEVLHLVLGSLSARCDTTYSSSVVTEEEHEAINHIIKCIFAKS